MAAGGLRARRRAVRLAGATSPDARRGARNRPERKPDDPDRRTGGGAVRLCQTQTWGALLPQVSVSGNYTRSIVKQEAAKGISFGADNTLSATGDVALPLFGTGRLPARSK